MPYTDYHKNAERRRFRAMTLLDKGLNQRQVADKVGVTDSAVNRWVKAREAGGDEALKAKPHPGPAHKLNQKQIARLEKLLLK